MESAPVRSLQQALSSLGFSAMLLIACDSSDLLTALPAALIGAGYSRDFESEAGLYALKTMQQHQIQATHYANFLQRLADNAGEKVSRERAWQDFFSSHPATYERIEELSCAAGLQASAVIFPEHC
ncbi:MAG: M48 family metalloprotease [Acinetobacter sp.]